MSTEGNPETEHRDEEAEQLDVAPFLDVQSIGGAQVRVQVGWASQEQVEELAIDGAVDASVAQDLIMTAFNWWLERWSEIIQANQEQTAENRPEE